MKATRSSKIIFLAAAIATSTANGVDLTWVGASGSNWSAPASWNPAQAPVAADNANFSGIATSLSANLDAVHAINNLVLASDAANTLTLTGTGDLNVGGTVSGNGGITLANAGVVTFQPNSASNYAGLTTVNSGTTLVIANADGGMNDLSGQTVVQDGGRLVFSVESTAWGAVQSRENIKIAGDGGGLGALEINGPTPQGSTFLQNLTLTNNATIAVTTRMDLANLGNQSLDLTNGGANPAGYTLTKLGTGFFGMNSGTTVNFGTAGAINIIQGGFGVEGNSPLPASGTVNMSPGTNLQMWGGVATRAARINLDSARISNERDVAGNTLSGVVSIAGTSTIYTHFTTATGEGSLGDQRLVISGPLEGDSASTLNKLGGGTLALTNAANTFGGTIAVNNGTLELGVNGALASGAIVNTSSGATVKISGDVGIPAASQVNIDNGANLEFTADVANSGSVNVNGGNVKFSNAGLREFEDSLAAADAGDPSFIPPVPDPAALTGVVSAIRDGNGIPEQTRRYYTGNLTNTSSSAVTYTFAEQYDDEVNISVGGAAPLINNNTWNAPTQGQVTLNPGETRSITIAIRNAGGGGGPSNDGAGGTNVVPDWSGFGVGFSTSVPLGGPLPAEQSNYQPISVASGIGINTGQGRTVSTSMALTDTVTFDTTGMFGSSATASGVLSGVGSVTVVGAAVAGNKMILSGANTYTGDTTVSANSTLEITGSHRSEANYVVSTGGTLNVKGTLEVGVSASAAGDLSMAIDGLALLDSTATIRLGLQQNLPGTGGASNGENDEIIFSGTAAIQLGGTLLVTNEAGLAFAEGNQFDLFDFGIAPAGNFASFILPSLAGGLFWDVSQVNSTGVLSVVPEPASGAILALGLAGLLNRRRRKLGVPV
jgi:autotransporter-associated beta strand protein